MLCPTDVARLYDGATWDSAGWAGERTLEATELFDSQQLALALDLAVVIIEQDFSYKIDM